jgi:4-diphosphocytidyl-2-C-methyl-D-erythritol kinase
MADDGRAPAGIVTRDAPAKINLNLHVTGRRDDGYHTLASLIAFADVRDTIQVGPAERLSLVMDGPFLIELEHEADNLVLEAARALAKATGVAPSARIGLTKNVPVAGGLGGGSADAAATLDALCELWGVRPDDAELDRIALSLGADVPVCRYGRPATVSGIGEAIYPAPALPAAWLVLVNPGVSVSTGAIFRARTGGYSAPPSDPEAAPTDAAALAQWLGASRNDLEAPARRVAPVIDDCLAALRDTDGCHLARMSGSGPTCFGIYADRATAESAAAAIQGAHPVWWVKAAALRR